MYKYATYCCPAFFVSALLCCAPAQAHASGWIDIASPVVGELSEGEVCARRFEQAKQCAAAGMHQDAIGLIEVFLVDYPGHIEGRMLYARLLGWTGQLEHAASQSDKVLSAVPSSSDAWQLRGDVAWWQGDLLKAREAYSCAVAIMPDNHGAQKSLERVEQAIQAEQGDPQQELQITDDPEQTSHEFTLIAGYERTIFDSQREDWTRRSLALQYEFDSHSLTLQRYEVERFGIEDAAIEFEAWETWAKGETLHLRAGMSDHGDVLPEWEVELGYLHSLPENWEIDLTVRHVVYSNVDVDSLRLSLARYVGPWWLEGNVSFSSAGGGVGAKARYYWTVKDWLEGGVNWGTEEVRVGPENYETRDSVALVLRGHWQFASRWYCEGDVIRGYEAAGPDRWTLGVRLGLEF